ncbi:MAG: hypothetical protein PWP12_438 [Bacillota bacterium]|jgi:hypothetical protein|nr:hypothetical protein [Bacillota bacterium]MDK2960254.1 hypothetical protein [Bacillota bacterium]
MASKKAPAGIPQEVLAYYQQFGLTAGAVVKLYSPGEKLRPEAKTFTPTAPVVVC